MVLKSKNSFKMNIMLTTGCHPTLLDGNIILTIYSNKNPPTTGLKKGYAYVQGMQETLLTVV